jgi:energy-coupling factor transport system permease protein
VLGQVNLTVEAVVYGLVFALRLIVVALACLLVVAAADPDELLMSLRRLSPRSALTAALSTRLVGVLGQDARRLAEAQRARPGGTARGTRARLAILRATVASALDRSLDVAAVLEMRGYGAAGRRRRSATARSRHDIAFAASAAGLLALALLALAGGAGSFHAYPLVHMSHSAGTFVLAGLLLAIALLPFADRRGIEP